jgi:hypothetical protein
MKARSGAGPEQDAIAPGRGEKLLAYELEGVHQGLQQALRSHVQGTGTALHESGHLAFGIDQDQAV